MQTQIFYISYHVLAKAKKHDILYEEFTAPYSRTAS